MQSSKAYANGYIYIYISSIVSIVLILFLTLILSNATPSVSADSSGNGTMNITINSACGFTSSSIGGTYSRTLEPLSTTTITGNNIGVSCNDSAGYSVYAIGYSGDSYSGTNTDLIHSTNTGYNIKTDGSFRDSYWKMKIAVSGGANIVGSYGSFQPIPSEYTQVAKYTTQTTSATITPSYQVHIGETQPAGTYTGKVK